MKNWTLVSVPGIRLSLCSCLATALCRCGAVPAGEANGVRNGRITLIPPLTINEGRPGWMEMSDIGKK